MGWKTPKTDWKAEDYFNYTDYNRIADNLVFIKEFVKKFSARIINLRRMRNKIGYSDFLEPEEVNNFQHNLNTINNQITHYDLGEDTIYVKAGHTPTNEQWNRIESFTYDIYDYMRSQTTLAQLTQKLGNEDSRRGIRI